MWISQWGELRPELCGSCHSTNRARQRKPRLIWSPGSRLLAVPSVALPQSATFEIGGVTRKNIETRKRKEIRSVGQRDSNWSRTPTMHHVVHQQRTHCASKINVVGLTAKNWYKQQHDFLAKKKNNDSLIAVTSILTQYYKNFKNRI